MESKMQHYEGPAARLADKKLVVAFDGPILLDLEYTGAPGWRYEFPVRYVRRVSVDYKLNKRGDKWLIQSLRVLDV